MITEQYYTHNEVYEKLALDLRLNDRGKDLLFDYLYNCDEDIEFEDYVNRFGSEYEAIAFKKPRKVKY